MMDDGLGPYALNFVGKGYLCPGKYADRNARVFRGSWAMKEAILKHCVERLRPLLAMAAMLAPAACVALRPDPLAVEN